VSKEKVTIAKEELNMEERENERRRLFLRGTRSSKFGT